MRSVRIHIHRVMLHCNDVIIITVAILIISLINIITINIIIIIIIVFIIIIIITASLTAASSPSSSSSSVVEKQYLQAYMPSLKRETAKWLVEEKVTYEHRNVAWEHTQESNLAPYMAFCHMVTSLMGVCVYDLHCHELSFSFPLSLKIKPVIIIFRSAD